MAAEDQLFNADLVWTLFFDDEPMATIVRLSLLSMLGVYGPMIGGIVATRIDASQSLDDLSHHQSGTYGFPKEPT